MVGGPFGDITRKAFFRGIVRYADIFGGQYIWGFCFVFDIDANRWVLMGGKEHNYCKRDKGAANPDWMQPTADPHSVRASINRAVLQTEGGAHPAEIGP